MISAFEKVWGEQDFENNAFTEDVICFTEVTKH